MERLKLRKCIRQSQHQTRWCQCSIVPNWLKIARSSAPWKFHRNKVSKRFHWKWLSSKCTHWCQPLVFDFHPISQIGPRFASSKSNVENPWIAAQGSRSIGARWGNCLGRWVEPEWYEDYFQGPFRYRSPQFSNMSQVLRLAKNLCIWASHCRRRRWQCFEKPPNQVRSCPLKPSHRDWLQCP